MKYSRDRFLSSYGRRALLLLGFCAFAFNTPAPAQGEARHGFWAGLGIGGGSGWFSGDSSGSSFRTGGWNLAGSLGGTLTPHLRLGAEYRFWQHGLSADKAPITQTGSVLLAYYPRVRGGPFFEAGGGLAAYMLGKGTGDPLESVSRDTTYNSGTGWGFTLGAGWDMPWMPRVTYAVGKVGTLHAPDGTTVATGWKQRLLVLEVGFRGWR